MGVSPHFLGSFVTWWWNPAALPRAHSIYAGGFRLYDVRRADPVQRRWTGGQERRMKGKEVIKGEEGGTDTEEEVEEGHEMKEKRFHCWQCLEEETLVTVKG